MSMNLHYFRGDEYVEFPYQTRTDLTYSVMDCDTKAEQLALIKKDCSSEHYEDIETMLSDPTVTLDYM